MVLSLVALTRTGAAQYAHSARFRPAPELAPGDRVRVLIRPPWYVRTRGPSPRITGELIDYAPLDSLTIRRTGLRVPWQPEIGTVYWPDIGRIDVPHGRNTLGGLGLGAGVAAGTVLTISFYCKIWAGEHCMSQAWQLSRRVVYIAIPAGAVWGFFSTRWKRVY